MIDITAIRFGKYTIGQDAIDRYRAFMATDPKIDVASTLEKLRTPAGKINLVEYAIMRGQPQWREQLFGLYVEGAKLERQREGGIRHELQERAAAFAEKVGRKDVAREISINLLELYEQRKSWWNAGFDAGKLGMIERAARNYGKGGYYLEAAELEERKGHADKAGKWYRVSYLTVHKTGNFLNAMIGAKRLGMDEKTKELCKRFVRQYIVKGGKPYVPYYLESGNPWLKELVDRTVEELEPKQARAAAQEEKGTTLGDMMRYSHNLLSAAQQTGDPGKLREVQMHVLETWEKIGEETGVSLILSEAAMLAHGMGLGERANQLKQKMDDAYRKQKAFEKFEQVADQAGAADWEIKSLVGQNKLEEAAGVARRNGDIEKAIGILSLAGKWNDIGFTLAPELKDPERKRQVYEKVVTMLELEGDNYHAALRAYEGGLKKRAMENWEVSGRKGDPFADSNLINAARTAGELAQEAGDEAGRSKFEQKQWELFDLAMEKSFSARETDIAQMAGEAAEKSGQANRAQHYFTLALDTAEGKGLWRKSERMAAKLGYKEMEQTYRAIRRFMHTPGDFKLLQE